MKALPRKVKMTNPDQIYFCDIVYKPEPRVIYAVKGLEDVINFIKSSQYDWEEDFWKFTRDE